MRLILFFIGQVLLGLAFFYLTYLPTYRIDFFEWGNKNTDGLYLLIVPFYLLPTIVLISIMKFFVTKGLKLTDTYKWSFAVSIASGLICTFLVIGDALWPTIVISMISTIAIVIETLITSRRFWAEKVDN